MKRVFDWLLKIASVLFVIILLAPVLLMVMFFLCLWLMDGELDSRNEQAITALNAIGLTEYTEYAPYYALSIEDTFAAFELPKYDNHVDNTDLWAGVMAHAASSSDWHVESVTADEYAALLKTHRPEAAFLFPAEITFDAWHQSNSTLAFFDQDSGLMVYLRTDRQPPAGTIRADKLTIPHSGFVYGMETLLRFRGDGISFRAFIIPEEQRAALEENLSTHTDWHKGTVTQAEYAVLQKCFYEYPGLLPSADVTFDWWSHVDTYARSHPDEEPDFDVHANYPAVMREAGARWSTNWLVALYDADTGLFIYYEYDS